MGHWTRRSLGSALIAGAVAMLALCDRAAAQAVTTDFTYQGELLENGGLADGVYDLRFRIYGAATGPEPAYQTVCVDDIEVVAGRFAAQLDFSPLLFADSAARYLEIAVRPGDVGTCADFEGYQTLAGRALITPTPYAITSMTSATATSANALGGTPAASFARRDAANTWTGPNTFSNATTFAAAIASTGNIQVGPFNAGTPLSVSSDASNGNTAFFTSLNPQSTILTLSNNAVGGRTYSIINTGPSHALGPGTLIIRDVSSSADRLAISPAGSVGIGTLTPSARLDVAGTANVAGVLTLGAAQGTAPLSVTSTTKVANLNADQLDGVDSLQFARLDQPNTFGAGNTFPSLQISTDLTVLQNLFTGGIVALQPVSALAPQGTAPLTVGSTTKVNNLNVDMLDGIDSPLFARRDQANTFGAGNSFAGLQVAGDLTATQGVFANSVVAQQSIAALAPMGVAPLIVSSNFKVNNLNVDMLDGIDSPLFARRDQSNAFGAGNTFAGLGVTGDINLNGNLFVTAIVAQDQIYALAPSGTAPFVVASTTKVNNLNADMLDGIIGAGYARIGGVNNFANDNTFTNVNVLGDFTGDTVAANAFALRTPATRALIIPAFAFQTDGQIGYFRGAHELRGTTGGSVLNAYAAVQLPHGATIRSISYNVYDNAASDLTLVLRSSAFASIPADTAMVVLNSSGTFATFATNTHTFATPYPVVDNAAKSYYLAVTIPVPAAPADLRLGDVRIEYVVTNPMP